MKILHLCLSCFYIDDYSYQENILPIINHQDGHEVMIIASTETFLNNCEIGYIEPSKYSSREGIPILRLPYSKLLPRFIMKKIRHYKGLFNAVEEFKPDVILFHGIAAYDLMILGRYKKKYPDTTIFVDSHEDYNNSATNFVSMYCLHKIFYRNVIRKSLKTFKKVLFISEETKIFLKEVYKVPDEIMEWFPLGGLVVDKETKLKVRNRVRSELTISNNDIVFCHSGKMSKSKRTLELLREFSKLQSTKVKLILIGSISSEISDEFKTFIEGDDRILYLGWKDSKDLIDIICSSDLYVQPGTQSATMQNALCSGTPVLIRDYLSHYDYMKGNAFMISEDSEMEEIFNRVLNDPELLLHMSDRAYDFAKGLLDYHKLASRLSDAVRG